MLTGIVLASWMATADEPPADVLDRIQSTRASISDADRRQREALSHLFMINKRIRDVASRSARLNESLMQHEADARTAAQEVLDLEARSDRHRDLVVKRLRQIYQERGLGSFQWLFIGKTPVEMERGRRFLRLMADADNRRMRTYLTDLRDLRRKRNTMKNIVARLVAVRKDIRAREDELNREMKDKSRLLAELKKSRALKLDELKDLRQSHGEAEAMLSYAFFERRGMLRAPVEGRMAHGFGTIVDQIHRFRLAHKGLFFASRPGAVVRAVHDGHVALSARIPDFGQTVILDHGDNYYSVYSFCSDLKVREGAEVREGDPVGLSGDGSPLFGPGLYFEIRHFTDAIDPGSWIKEPAIRTAHADGE